MLYVIRHGETIWNKKGKMQGQSDSPLTLKGIEQTKHYSKILTHHIKNIEEFDFVVSPLGRTQQTAQIILDSLGLEKEVILEPLAKEKHNGPWEGDMCDLIEEQYSKIQDNWNYQHGNGESQEIFYNRVVKLLDKYKNKKIVLVTHGGVSLFLRSIISGTEKDLDLMVSKNNWQKQDEIFHIKDNQEIIRLKLDITPLTK